MSRRERRLSELMQLHRRGEQQAKRWQVAEQTAFLNGKWSSEVERTLRDALRNLRFGTVTLVVQDGRIIQIDRSEKFRLTRAEHINGSGI